MKEEFKKKYDKLIEKVKKENRGVEKLENHGYFYNIHHIVPLGLGGEDSTNNLIKLTLKEHFDAHELLAKMYVGTEFEVATKNMFNRFGNDSKTFVLSQKRCIDRNKYLNVNLGRIPNSETRKKMSKAQIGNDNAKGTVRSDDFKKMISSVHKGNTVVKGRVHITNGTINKMIYLKDGIPEGFVRGRTIVKK